jgi:hypothetical protein
MPFMKKNLKFFAQTSASALAISFPMLLMALPASASAVDYSPETTSAFFDRLTMLWNPLALTSDPDFGIAAGQSGFTIYGTASITFVIEAPPDLADPITFTDGLHGVSGPELSIKCSDFDFIFLTPIYL